MSIASAFLDPTFYDGLTNVHIVSPPSVIPSAGIFATQQVDNSRLIVDKVNRLVYIFLNVSATLSVNNITAQTGLLWQYRAYQNPIGNQLPSVPASLSNLLQARVMFSNGATVVPADIFLNNDGGNINIYPNNTVNGLVTTGTTVISGTIIYPY